MVIRVSFELFVFFLFGKDKLVNLYILKFFFFNLVCLKFKEVNFLFYEDFIKVIIKMFILSRIKKDFDLNMVVWIL